MKAAKSLKRSPLCRAKVALAELTKFVILFLGLCLIQGLILPRPSGAQEQAPAEEEPVAEQDATGSPPEEPPSESSSAPSAKTGGTGKEVYAIGITFQNWSPFTGVTSSALTEVAGGLVVKTKGDNAKDVLSQDEVSTKNVAIVSFESSGGGLLDKTAIDLTENSDISRLNPFASRAELSSNQKNLNSQLKKEKQQTSRLNTQLSMLGLERFDPVVRVVEENFVSTVKPKVDNLFISSSGAEALITSGTKIQLETSFEEKMGGFSALDMPIVNIGFIGYFETLFQKPVLLTLPKTVSVTLDNVTSSVSSVIIFPQFSAKGSMIEWYKSTEEGFDISGFIKWGNGNINLGEGSKKVNSMLLASIPKDGSQDVDLFSKSAQILYYASQIRLSYLGETLETNFTSHVRVFTLTQKFNGVKATKPLSIDAITSFNLLYRF